MRNRATKLLLATALVLTCAAGTALAGVLLYANDFPNKASVLELRRVIVPGLGTRCKRQATGGRMVVTVGKSTTECDYSPPVHAASGSSGIDILAKATLSTSSNRPKKTFVSVGVRANADGTAGKYRLDVSPGAQRYALRRYSGTEDAAHATTLATAKKGYIHPPGQMNKIRLKVFNSGGTATLVAKINGRTVATRTDAAPLSGLRQLISLGRAAGSGQGGQGLFDKLIVRSI